MQSRFFCVCMGFECSWVNYFIALFLYRIVRNKKRKNV